MKQQEDKPKLSADGEGSDGKASAGRPCAANALYKEKANTFTCQLCVCVGWGAFYCRLCVTASLYGCLWPWGFVFVFST